MLGPVLQVVGLVLLFGGAAAGARASGSLRQLAFDPAILIIAVGLLVSLTTLPVALAVAAATDEEVRAVVFAQTDEAAAGDGAAEVLDGARS